LSTNWLVVQQLLAVKPLVKYQMLFDSSDSGGICVFYMVVIYVLLGVFIYYQSTRGEEYVLKIGWLFIASCILNIAWLFLWQLEYLVFSVVVIFLLLASLVAIYLRLGIGERRLPLREKIAFHLQFSVYPGWIVLPL